MTGAQFRQARALLGWSIATVAARTGLSAELLRSVEAAEQHEILTGAQSAKLHHVLYCAGLGMRDGDVHLRSGKQ